ncbi:MAG: PAQR family membrane homeostasis protein TrhA [Candidatus Bipolaricaulaceae bacterium]
MRIVGPSMQQAVAGLSRGRGAAEAAWDSLTHGLGLALSLIGLGVLLATGAQAGTARHLIAAAVYGTAMVAAYGASTLYHALGRRPALRLVDHAGVYALIAGTYTPFALITLWGPWGWALLTVIWTLAGVGVALKLKYIGRYKVLSVAFYLAMGWLAVVACGPLQAALPAAGFWLVIGGGMAYSAGVAFFALGRSVRYMHAVWHVFVLAGSGCHFAAVLLFVLPPG